MADAGVSAGEIGGVFAGATALAIATGHGIKWLFGFGVKREEGRAAKLQVWHEELAERERKINEGQTAYTAGLERRIAKSEADANRLRHKFGNLDSLFDSLLLLIEMEPDRAREIVATIREKRAEQRRAEAAESGAQHGAAIAIVTAPEVAA